MLRSKKSSSRKEDRNHGSKSGSHRSDDRHHKHPESRGSTGHRKKSHRDSSAAQDPKIPRRDIAVFPEEFAELSINSGTSAEGQDDYVYDSIPDNIDDGNGKGKGKGKGKADDDESGSSSNEEDDSDGGSMNGHNDGMFDDGVEGPVSYNISSPPPPSTHNFGSEQFGSAPSAYPVQAYYNQGESQQYPLNISTINRQISTDVPTTNTVVDSPDDNHSNNNRYEGEGGKEGESEGEEDMNLKEAIKRSKQLYRRGHGTEGESSSSNATPWAHRNYHTGTKETIPEHQEVHYGAPSPVAEHENRQSTTTLSQDSRYGVFHSNYYQPGQVIKVVWAEPKGQSNKHPLENTGGYPYSEVLSYKGESNMFYTGVRRFIITASDFGSSVCIPILTYENRACLKKGVKAENHGIVYAPPSPPCRLKGEPDHGFLPIRMRLYAEGESLVEESRVNYNKLVTIEHNINVLFIGSVYEEDLPFVSKAVDICWARRVREPKGNSHEKKKKKRH